MKKILNILSLYLTTLKPQESHHSHNLISFVLVRSIGLLNEKVVEFADHSRKKFQQKLQEKKSNDEEESSVLREFTDWLAKTNDFFEEKLKQTKTGVISKEFRGDVEYNLSHDKINIFLQYHKRTQLVRENNKLISCLFSLTEEMNSQKQTALVASERATLSEKFCEHMKENIHASILRREAESRNIIAHKQMSRDDVQNMIRDEFNVVKISANQRVKHANMAIKLSGEIMRYQQSKIAKLDTMVKRKTIPVQSVAVQFSVRDTLDIPELTDVQAYFKSVNSFIVGGQPRTVQWATLVITDIFSQKMWADYQDNKAGRDLVPLKVFLLQYFMKQFGCRVMAVTLLKDFLATLKGKFLEEQRLEIFLDLSGHAELKHAHNVDMKTYLDKHEVASRYQKYLAFMELPSSCGFFLNLVLMVRQSKRSSSAFLLPNSKENNNYLIPVTEALEISTKLFKKYGFNDHVLSGIKNELASVAQKDLFLRVAHSTSINKDKEISREKFISFDSLAQYINLS